MASDQAGGGGGGNLLDAICLLDWGPKLQFLYFIVVMFSGEPQWRGRGAGLRHLCAIQTVVVCAADGGHLNPTNDSAKSTT